VLFVLDAVTQTGNPPLILRSVNHKINASDRRRITEKIARYNVAFCLFINVQFLVVLQEHLTVRRLLAI